MICSGTCELTEFRVKSARVLELRPRPDGDAASDLERRLLDLVRGSLETSSHDCESGCECVAGEPVLVSSREQVRKATLDGYDAWVQVTLAKYRTPGECMPVADPLPGDADGA